MDPHIHLIIHNAAFGLSGLIALGLAIFALVNNPRRVQNLTFTFSMLAVAVFVFSHIIGVSVEDHILSRSIFMFNMSTIFIVIFNTHCILSVVNRVKERKTTLVVIYLAGIILTTIYAFFPHFFLEPSIVKMYFPNYYVPGMYHWIMRVIFNGIVPVYSMIELIIAYRASRDIIEKTRYTYFLGASIVGYAIGSIPILLVYNIPVDPIWGSFFVLFYAVPLLYAIVEYELLHIQIIAKRAFVYTVACATVGLLMIIFEFTNQWIARTYPQFPLWVTPIIPSILIVSTIVFIWRKLRENDLLKYEFITTVTHKFRTPLTYVRWATESLLKSNLDEESRSQIGYIQSANAKLVELTDLLANVSDAENKEYGYQMNPTDLSTLITEVVDSLRSGIAAKKLQLQESIEPQVRIMCDASRMKFVIQVLLENALHYTKEGGYISFTLRRDGRRAIVVVKDNGIGISKEHLALLFSKFYRSGEARKADTEGMGIGLYLAKEIVVRHRGILTADSEGIEKGSVFTLSLPLIS